MRPFERIFAEPEYFDFYFVARWLERAQYLRALEHKQANEASTALQETPRIGDSARLKDNYASFRQLPYFAFPDSNLAKAEKTGHGVGLSVKFLGLTGPQGAMPLAVTEEAYRYGLLGDEAFAHFLDLFNNRFIQLFFRAWADSRPITHRDWPQKDRFERYIAGFIGLGTDPLRNRDSVPDLVKIGYAGLIAPKAKSASRLRSLLSGIFQVEVDIEEFVGFRLPMEADQLTNIGRQFSSLGSNIMLGDAVYSVQDKIRIRIRVQTMAQYAELLPSGPKSRLLRDVVHFYLGMEIAWDVELAIPETQTAPVQLGSFGQLSWTTWLASSTPQAEDSYRTDARFDLMSRFANSQR